MAIMASSISSRKVLAARRGQQQRSPFSLSTNGAIRILLIIVVAISCSLLGAAFFIFHSMTSNNDQQQLLPQDHHAVVMEPGRGDKLRRPNQAPDDPADDDDVAPIKLKPMHAAKLAKYHNNHNEITRDTKLAAVKQFQAEFHTRYGNKYSKQIQQNGVQRFGSVQTTAQRLLRAAAQERPFRMSFAGYSVTVGRGNFFEQSYPFRLQAVLQPLLQKVFDGGLELQVINAAIGGIPSFPYAWCLSHFLGPQPDVVSWDFSMNEVGRDNTAVMEAYVRQVQHQYRESKPLLISLDNHKGRCRLLEQYADQGWLSEALCVARAEAVFDKPMLERFKSADSDSLAPGLQRWNEFGAPPSCPGRSSWHPKQQEHELIAWMIAMDFAEALEYAVGVMQQDPDWKQTFRHTRPAVDPTFPRPVSPHLFDNSEAVHKLLYGHEYNDNNGRSEGSKQQYKMHDVSCRTNFLPATDSDKVLPSIVASGLASTTTAQDFPERSDADYESGWVLDVSKVERETKRKVEKCGGLGYVDMKLALYGIPQSGPLQLWLPVESHIHSNEHHSSHDHNHDEPASHWFDSIVLCEANEKRSDQACQLQQDLTIMVGGVRMPPNNLTMIHGAGEYLKRPTCVHVSIPETAQMTQFHDLDAKVQQRLAKARGHDGDDLNAGLLLQVEAGTRVTRQAGACCLSHVAWELH